MSMSTVVQMIDENGAPLELPEDEETTDEGFPPYLEDDLNLVRTFKSFGQPGADALKKVAEHVTENFNREWEATKEYREKQAANWKIFSGFLPAKDFPWQDCANVNVPIAIENTARLAFRIYGELFGDFSNVFGVLPLGPDDKQIAYVLTKHGNWQLRNQIIDFPCQMDRATLTFLYVGNLTGHSFFDPDRGQNRHEVLTPDQFVVPYTHVATMPDYSDMPFMVKILQLQRHELQARREEWEGVDEVIKKVSPSYDDEPEQEIGDMVAEAQGTEKADDSKYAPYKILWFEGFMELPNQTRDRYVQAFVDPNTRAVLKLTIHEQPDWQDQRRYEKELAERDAYLQALDAYDQQLFQMQQTHQETVSGLEEGIANVERGHEEGTFGPLQSRMMTDQISGMIPPPPAPPPEPPQPTWMADGEPDEMGGPPMPAAVKRVPLRLFSRCACIEPLVGSLGFGYGHILADFNRAANTALSQFVDAATLANAGGGIIHDSVQFVDKKDEGNRPGRWKRVSGLSPEEMSKGIVPWPVPQANDQLVQVVQMVMGFAQNAVQAPSVLSGDPGKSGETFRGINARIEQATKQISVVASKLRDWVVQILKNNAQLNAIHLRDEELFEVTDDISQTGQPLVVTRRMYERDYRVEIRADLRFTAQAQRIQEAQEMLQTVMQLPTLQMNPDIPWLATKNLLEAMGKTEFIPLLGPQPTTLPPPPAPPPGAVPGGPPPPGGPPGGGPPHQQPGGPPPSPGPKRMGPPAPGPANA